MPDLRSGLASILPLAIAWAETQSRRMLAIGVALTDAEQRLARSVGVSRPELVRVASVQALPHPDEPLLRDAALRTRLLGPGSVGLTLGYAIVVVTGHQSPRLLSHELRHVHQYEAAGSIAAFLPVYLRQIVDFGYLDAPLERDARAHELSSERMPWRYES